MQDFEFIKVWFEGLFPDQQNYIASMSLFMLPIDSFKGDLDRTPQAFLNFIENPPYQFWIEKLGLLLSLMSIIDYVVEDFDDTLKYDNKQQEFESFNLKHSSKPSTEYPRFEENVHAKTTWKIARDNYLNVSILSKRYS